MEKVFHKPFKKPVFVTRPILPPLSSFVKELRGLWKSRWLSNAGINHQMLETALKHYLHAANISLFSNGTIGLLTMLRALDLDGDIITTPFTFPATPHCLTWNGLSPVFADIDPITMNIDPQSIEKMITKRTSAILAVHVFGSPCDVTQISKIAKQYRLKVIYDGAHAFGMELKGRSIASYGDATMFSFHPTKLFHTAEGGAIVSNTRNLKERIDLLKNFGIKNEDEVVLPGINGKMNEIQSVLGLLMLKEIDKERTKRHQLLKAYLHYLKYIPGIYHWEDPDVTKRSFQYFVIKINEKEFGKSRDFVYNEFKKYNVFTRRYFYPLCSEYPHYKDLRSSKKENLPNAHAVVKEVLCMPFHGALEVSDIEHICFFLDTMRHV